LHSEVSDPEKSIKKRIIIRLIKLLDIIAVTAVFGGVWMHFYASNVYRVPFYNKGNWVVIALFMVTYYYLAHLYQGFYIHISRVSEIIYAQDLAAALADAFLFAVTVLLSRRIPNVLPMLLCLLGQSGVSFCWSSLAHRWYFSHFERKKTIIIFDEMEGLEDLIAENGLDKRYDVIDTIGIDAVDQQYIDRELPKSSVVFLCCVHSHERNQIIKFCVENHISIFVIPRIGDVLMSGAQKMHLMHLPILLVNHYSPAPEYLFLKRIFDIAISGAALMLLSPLMIILALIIRSDGGTAFYRQVRLTRDGKKFHILKFRSMKMNAEEDGIARLSTGERDDRITAIGHFIRACRMDELPQLINILKGDMSIVGPRPERPEIAAQYRETFPEFDLRLQCKCGLTGYAQVYGKYNSTPYDKLLMDLMYIAQPSLAEDVKICLATVKILFMKDSTEGIAEGQITASAGSRENTGVAGPEEKEK
jgi:lipopolysaccharide/colanic/teichoic acid biosynthesis glycosyltransferase